MNSCKWNKYVCPISNEFTSKLSLFYVHIRLKFILSNLLVKFHLIFNLNKGACSGNITDIPWIRIMGFSTFVRNDPEVESDHVLSWSYQRNKTTLLIFNIKLLNGRYPDWCPKPSIQLLESGFGVYHTTSITLAVDLMSGDIKFQSFV